MKLVKGSTTLVVVGSWNTAILQPDWLAINALQVQTGAPIPMTMEFGPGIGFLPRLSIDGVVIAPGPDRLQLSLENVTVESLDRLEQAAHRTLTALPHTPISAFGENFDFVEEDPSSEEMSLFNQPVDLPDRLGEKFEPIASSLKQTVQLEGRLLNVTRELNSGSFFLRFNFHYTAANAAEAADRLSGQFRRNWQVVSGFLRSYGVDGESVLKGKV